MSPAMGGHHPDDTLSRRYPQTAAFLPEIGMQLRRHPCLLAQRSGAKLAQQRQAVATLISPDAQHTCDGIIVERRIATDLCATTIKNMDQNESVNVVALGSMR